jgi:hypothetical protein
LGTWPKLATTEPVPTANSDEKAIDWSYGFGKSLLKKFKINSLDNFKFK